MADLSVIRHLRGHAVRGAFGVVCGGSLALAAAGYDDLLSVAMVFGVALVALIGAWSSPWMTMTCCVIGAALLTAANQLSASNSYTPTNDFVFFLVILAAPAVVGALWMAATVEQARLRRLGIIHRRQRDAEVLLARLREQNRLELELERGVIQQLGMIVLQAEGAVRVAALPALQAIEDAARLALDGLRRHVGVLCGSDGPEPPPTPASWTQTRGVGSRPAVRMIDLVAAASGIPLAVEVFFSEASRGPAVLNVLAALLVCAPLVLRRRYPAGTVVAVMVLAVLTTWMLTPVSATVTMMIPLLLVAYAPGAYAVGPERWAGVVLACMGVVLVAWAGPEGGGDSDGLVPSLVMVSLGFGSGIAVHAQRRRADRLAELVKQIDEGRPAELALAIATERQEEARILHDSLAHTLTVLCVQAAAARHGPADNILECLAVIGTAAREGMAGLRAGIMALDPDGPPRETLTLDDVIARAVRSGMRVAITRDGAVGDLPAKASEVLATVVREALVNASRYAPGSAVEITVRGASDEVEVEVVDDGPDRVQASAEPFIWGTGSGLGLLAAWVASSGGALDASPREAAGFRVCARIPLGTGASA